MSNDVSGDLNIYLRDSRTGFRLGSNLRWNRDYHTSIVAGDFDGDGKLDLVTPDYWSSGMAILFGNGDGTFQPAFDYPANRYPLYLQAADLDRDGNLDLVTPNAGTNNITVLQNNGGGAFRRGVTFTSGVRNTRTMAIGDFNGDGQPDVAAASDTTSLVAILLNETRIPPRQ